MKASWGKKLLLIGFVTTAIVLRVATETTANMSYLVIAVFAFFGREQAIQALALSWLFSMLNPGVVPEATALSVGRYAVLGGAAFSVFFRSVWVGSSPGISRPVLATLLLGIFLVSHSLLFSPMADISVLKAVLWTVAVMTLLSAWGGLSQEVRDALLKQIFGSLIVVMLVSLPLLATPLGRLRNDTGFQGILGHPQVFGSVMGLLGAWAASRIVVTKKPSWWLLGLVLGCLVLIVLSECRTGGFAFLLGVALATVFAPTLSGRTIRELFPGFASPRLFVVLGLLLLGSVPAWPVLVEHASTYLAKGHGAQNLAEAYEASRGRKIDEMLENIGGNFWGGIGFGIASNPAEMIIERDPVVGLPTSAIVEKGVLPLAVWEELGIFGFAFVALWLWMLSRRAARGGGVTSLTVVATSLLLNMGESTFFSPGGMGLLLLILLGWCATERQPYKKGFRNVQNLVLATHH